MQSVLSSNKGSLMNIEDQLSLYKAFHFHHKNVEIHMVCIPLIAFTLVVLLSDFKVSEYPYLNLGTLLSLSYGAYYIALHKVVGSIASVGIAFFVVSSKWLYENFESSTVAKVAGTVHVLGWLAQFYGHAVYEKRRPALIDNLLQPVVLAPYFVVFECLFSMGYFKELEHKMGVTAKKMKDADLKAAREKST
ncbi:hypothetical protein CANARDRAFT_22474 [[Candida] arabinofermentans NRRL YB-2248]|uniref:DUF962 domain-containing protein n=1 Tax=[Candida] arabinofermentans NRRL YB-2248 TaxID=983967 RepID=A0A1E4T1R5_9ASCO|nr:hypothetical protein CANARDRAFT_22474 [[Candida] arabinofermentans NRRL YB-2248]